MVASLTGIKMILNSIYNLVIQFNTTINQHQNFINVFAF